MNNLIPKSRARAAPLYPRSFHRVILPDEARVIFGPIYEWLEEHKLELLLDYFYELKRPKGVLGEDKHVFGFRDRNTAILFKLRFR